jgi:Zn-dependent protease with chaperone function
MSTVGLPAIYHDGRTSRPRPAVLHFAADGQLTVEVEGEARVFTQAEVAVDSRLGNAPRFVRLPDGGRCEVADHTALDHALAAWPPQRAAAWLHRVERSWRWVLAATVVLLAVGWAGIHFGLPWAARQVAFALPAKLTTVLGDQTLTLMDKAVFEPTQLPVTRQEELREKFRAFLLQAGDAVAYRVEFRAGGKIGANAFALPSGTIVLTDELVALAKDDGEILGVLAHECGHVRQRHILRTVLQNSAVFLVLALATGDVSSATAFGGALPTYLLQSRFSRVFEAEADAEAAAMMRAAQIPPARLAAMLERLEQAHTGMTDGLVPGYFLSHPPTPERVRALRE